MGLKQKIVVSSSQDGLEIEGAFFALQDSEGASIWEGCPLDKDRVLLYTKLSHEAFSEDNSNFAKGTVFQLRSLLLGLIKNGFTGSIQVDTGRGNKKIFFQSGELVFASSDQMDDRLGEVIYREKLIDLENMTNAAVKVSRAQKFGQILLESGIYEPFQLWEALKMQVKDILDSIFLVNHVFYQVKEDELPPTKVYYCRSSELVETASMRGQQFRSFLKNISLDSVLRVNDTDPGWVDPESGTFEHDMISLIKGHSVLADFIKNSKLSDLNSYLALFDMVNQGLCKIDLSRPSLDITQPLGEPRLAEFKAKVDLYQHLLAISQESLLEENLEMTPISQLRKLLRSLSSRGGEFVRLDEKGNFEYGVIDALVEGGKNSPYVLENVVFVLDSLSAFLLQVVCDRLPYEEAKRIKKSFSEHEL